MAITVTSPQFSFVQFGESSLVTSCNFPDIHLALPVYSENDVWFQFTLDTETSEEADALSSITNDSFSIGIVGSCDDDFLLEFDDAIERVRIGDTKILYNWKHGVPAFDTVIGIGECFYIKIKIDDGVTVSEYCSNAFQRIADDCHTTVVEYGNDDDAFDFNYCNSLPLEDSDPCEPTFIQFSNRATLNVPYTTSLQNKYGDFPNVQVWIYDGSELVDANIRPSLNGFPPTALTFDFGGMASGVIRIN